MTEEEVMALARLHRGNQDWEAFSHFSQVGLLTFVRAIEQASRRAALEEAVRVTAQSQTTSHACDAIRALTAGDKHE